MRAGDKRQGPRPGLLLVALLLASSAVHTEACLFFLGSSCLLAVRTARRLIGGQLVERGLEQPVERVTNLCRLMRRYSWEGVLAADVAPLVLRLVRLTAANLTAAGSLDEFELTVRGLASLSVGASPSASR
jgi:hypothetical protein